MLAQLYQQQNNSTLAKRILREALEKSTHNIYWHSKFLFQIAQMHVSEKEYGVASELLQLGVDAVENAEANYLKTLFLLSKAMILIIERKTNAIQLLNQAELIIESIQNVHLKEYLRVFFLILQVIHYLQLGQIKSVKTILKQLQSTIQLIIAAHSPSDEQIFGQNPTEMFMWLAKEEMYVLVYLVTVSHSMMAGYMDKAQKYTEKALTQIEKLKGKSAIKSIPKSLLESNKLLLIYSSRQQANFSIVPSRNVGAHHNVSFGHGQQNISNSRNLQR